MPKCFSDIFTKGNNLCDFLFASKDVEAIPKWVYTERKEFAPLLIGVNSDRREFAPGGANSFLSDLTPIQEQILSFHN